MGHIFQYGDNDMLNLDWNKFHDWMIGTINLDWGIGVVRICLHFENDREIEIKGLRSISISRNLPWGMSGYINSIKCE